MPLLHSVEGWVLPRSSLEWRVTRRSRKCKLKRLFSGLRQSWKTNNALKFVKFLRLNRFWLLNLNSFVFWKFFNLFPDFLAE